MSVLHAIAMALFAGAQAFGPTANPAEALDEAACVGLRLQALTAAEQPLSVQAAHLVPRAGDVPSHCFVTVRPAGSDSVIEIRLPIAPWTGTLRAGASGLGPALARGDAIAQGANPELALEAGQSVAVAYYGRPPRLLTLSPPDDLPDPGARQSRLPNP